MKMTSLIIVNILAISLDVVNITLIYKGHIHSYEKKRLAFTKIYNLNNYCADVNCVIPTKIKRG